MYATGSPPVQIVEEKCWKTMKDTGALLVLIEKVLDENPAIVADIRERGLVQKRGFLVGQVMKFSQGKADPADVNRLLDEKLNA